MRIPTLLIQPLVENAIKHGISPIRAGGEVVILARLVRGRVHHVSGAASGDDMLQIWVRDTGAGASEADLAHGRSRGVGLANIEQRVRCHYAEQGVFAIRSAPGVGTTVELSLPITAGSAFTNGKREPHSHRATVTTSVTEAAPRRPA